MKFIIQLGNMYVSDINFNIDYKKDGADILAITFSKDYFKIMSELMAYKVKKYFQLRGIPVALEKITIENSFKEEIEFLRQRENKLQRIEQLFKSEVVDLEELTKIVKEDK